MNRTAPTRWITVQDQLCLLYEDDPKGDWTQCLIALIYESMKNIWVNTWTHGETGKYRGIDCGSWEDAKEEALDRLVSDGTLTPTQADVIRRNDGQQAGGFVKADAQKPAFDLIPPNALESIAAVLEHGARKYAADNWMQVDRSRRYPAAALRHIFRWLGGERLDKESGLPHLAHAAASLLFACEIEHLVLQGKVQTVDDRPFSDTDWKVHRA